MASSNDLRDLTELPEALPIAVAKILSAFDSKADIDLDPSPNSDQHYTGLHDQLEELSGVNGRSDSEPRTLTPEQREVWSQRLRSFSQNANKQVLAARCAKETSQKLDKLEQRLAKMRSEAMEDPRLRGSFEYFAGKKPKEIRQPGIKMMIENLKRSPELINDLLQEIAPAQAVAQSKIDDALAFGKEKGDLAQERIEAAEKLQKQIQDNITALQEAEWNIANLASKFQTLQVQKDEVEQGCRSEVEEAKQELETARSDLRNTQEKADTLQKKCNAAFISEVQKMKDELQKAKKSYFDESVRYQLMKQNATTLEGKLGDALRSKEYLELQVQSKASQIDSEATIISQLRVQVENQTELIERRATELTHVGNNLEKAQSRIKNLKHERDSLETSLNTSKGENKDLEERLSGAQAEIDLLKARLSTTESARAALQRGLTSTEGERDALKARLDTTESARGILRRGLTSTEGERDALKARLNTAEGEKNDLQSSFEEAAGERDELNERLALLTRWNTQIIAFAEFGKLTIQQTGHYSADMLLSMNASLTAVEAFRENLDLTNIRSPPLPVSRIYGINADLDPAMRSGNRILFLFGQLHTGKCRIPLIAIGMLSQALEGLDVRARRLSLLLLCGFLHKRCALAQVSANPCTLAASLVILRCVEILQCHLSSTTLLEFVMKILKGVKEKLMPNSSMVCAFVERLTSEDRSLVECLSAQEFITIPGSNYKVTMDQDMLIAVKDDREIAYIRPCFYRLQVSTFHGWNFVFDGAPMLGSWTTPVWDVRTHMMTLVKVLDSAVAQTISGVTPLEVGAVEHELVDMVV